MVGTWWEAEAVSPGSVEAGTQLGENEPLQPLRTRPVYRAVRAQDLGNLDCGYSVWGLITMQAESTKSCSDQ